MKQRVPILVALMLAIMAQGVYGGTEMEGARLLKSVKPMGQPAVLVKSASMTLAHEGEKMPRRMDVTLFETHYAVETVRLIQGHVETWKGGVTCWELRSTTDPTFSWTCWNLENPGHPQIFGESDGKSVLAWVHGSSVEFEEITGANDRVEELFHEFNLASSNRIQRVPLGDLVPEVKTWGFNALYCDIRVVSLETQPGGGAVMQFSQIGSDKVITVVRENGQWRVQNR